MALRSGAIRDLLILAAVFGALLGGLYLYTATWPPAVIVESGSMMHADEDVSYGRSWVGGTPTIDPGDLVLVKRVESYDDIETFVERGENHYGKPGDVVVYFAYRGGRPMETPIIHRAMAYVEAIGSGSDVEYRVRWNPAEECEGGARKDANWCVYGAGGITIPSVPMTGYKRGSSETWTRGIITKGDNPSSNSAIDQQTGLSSDASNNPSPVQLEWIQGKGRAELPWLGLIKLSFAGKYNQADCAPPVRAGERPSFHFFEPSKTTIGGDTLKCPGWVGFGYAFAPKDLWVMLGVSLFVLVGVPLLYDLYRTIRHRRDRKEPPDEIAPPSG